MKDLKMFLVEGESRKFCRFVKKPVENLGLLK